MIKNKLKRMSCVLTTIWTQYLRAHCVTNWNNT